MRHGPLTYLLPPVMGSMLEFQAPAGITTLRLYISGDTLLNKDLKEIPRRYPGIDMAVLHLGGTKIMGVMLTMDAKQGVQAIKLIAPRVAIPVHYNDYPVFKSPLEDFQKAVASAGLTRRLSISTVVRHIHSMCRSSKDDRLEAGWLLMTARPTAATTEVCAFQAHDYLARGISSCIWSG